jgi:hypothetical protein
VLLVVPMEKLLAEGAAVLDAAEAIVSFRQECVTGWEAVSSASSATI